MKFYRISHCDINNYFANKMKSPHSAFKCVKVASASNFH